MFNLCLIFVGSLIIINEGGITSHAAIISRELGIPCIIGTQKATSILRTGMAVRVDANRGCVLVIKKIIASKPITKNYINYSLLFFSG